MDWKRIYDELKSKETCLLCHLERRLKMKIGIREVMIALDNERIRVWQDVDDDSAKCQIGDTWFYFTHIEEDTRLEDFSTDELAEMIANTINDAEGNGLGDAEADYYKAVITEIVYDLFVDQTGDENGEVDNNYFETWLKEYME